ncbi:MAG: secretin N-terminal domain-containing protein [Desulfobacterales bacterium]
MNKIAIYLIYLLILPFMASGIIGPAFGESSAQARRETPQTPAGSQKSASGPVLRNEAAFQPSKNDLISVNFLDMDIRKVLSAIAMEREINISTAPEVTGNISIHLYRVPLEEALTAITLAGGCRYKKLGDLYFIFKSQGENAETPVENVQMRVFKLKYVDVEKVQEILEGIPGMRMVKINKATNTVVVEDVPLNIAKVETILRSWDVPPKQVIIEAQILEVELTDDMTLGVQWDKILGDGRIATRFGRAVLPQEAGGSPVPKEGVGLFSSLVTGVGTSHQFAIALDVLQEKTKVNILSTPRIMAIHGKPARVQVGGQQGYRVTTISNGLAVESIEFIDTGTILEITPQIVDDENILLEVQPSIDAARIEEGGLPVVKTTTVRTSLLAKNGQTIFIGGLIQESKSRLREQVPLFGDIPVIGALFGRTDHSIGKSELIVLITPHIVDHNYSAYQQFAIQKTNDIKQSLKKEPRPPLDAFHELLIPEKDGP